MSLKLKWNTEDSLYWDADFAHGLLDLRIDYREGLFGIYDADGAVWQRSIFVSPDGWKSLAQILETELSSRLYQFAETLDPSILEPPPQFEGPAPLEPEELCDVCGQYKPDVHKGFYEHDDSRCYECLTKYMYKIACDYGLSLNPPVPEPEPVPVSEPPSYDQVAASIAEEARTIRL